MTSCGEDLEGYQTVEGVEVVLGVEVLEVDLVVVVVDEVEEVDELLGVMRCRVVDWVVRDIANRFGHNWSQVTRTKSITSAAEQTLLIYSNENEK